MDAEVAVAPPGCSHLGSFKVDNWKQNLRAIYQCFVWSGTAEARKRKVCPRPAPLSCLGRGEWGGGEWEGSLSVRGGGEGKASRCREGTRGGEGAGRSLAMRGGARDLLGPWDGGGRKPLGAVGAGGGCRAKKMNLRRKTPPRPSA